MLEHSRARWFHCVEEPLQEPAPTGGTIRSVRPTRQWKSRLRTLIPANSGVRSLIHLEQP